MGYSKTPITKDVINKLLSALLNLDFDRGLNHFFTIDLLVKNNALQKYKEQQLGDLLRKHITLGRCRNLVKPEEELTDKDLLSILRSALREYGFILKSTYCNSGPVKRGYYFEAPTLEQQ